MAASITSPGTSGTTSALVVGTETTVATLTTAGLYVLRVKLDNMAAGVTPDGLEYCVYQKVLAADGSDYLLDRGPVWLGAGTGRMWESKPYLSAVSVRFTLTQYQGTGRAFAWNVTSG